VKSLLNAARAVADLRGLSGDPWVSFTDSPGDLTIGEAAAILEAGRLAGITLHREWTRSTLAAAVKAVDALQP
jgi:hypothetical protein